METQVILLVKTHTSAIPPLRRLPRLEAQEEVGTVALMNTLLRGRT